MFIYSTEKAAQQLRKLNYASSYSRFFGKFTEVSKGEAEILKFKKFSELDISTILSPMAVAYIDSWTKLGEDDSYVNLALSALR
jgi:hypothetical protein